MEKIKNEKRYKHILTKDIINNMEQSKNQMSQKKKFDKTIITPDKKNKIIISDNTLATFLG